ncbi:MAG TPA: MEDS domain-containing protein [Polyangia bacterium]
MQFYENDGFLCQLLTDFAADGLRAGDAVILIATDAHRAEVRRRLIDRGVDPDAAVATGGLSLLDARAVLAAVMVDGTPSYERFATSFRGMLEPARTGGRRARLFGEMVDVLWRDGNHGAAILLEEMANALMKDDPIAVLCAYAMDNFVKASDAAAFASVCVAHGDVRPAEGYALAGDADARSRETARLQQRARALESELAQRHDLEVALRQALDRERIASQAKDRFLTLLGHELRNPLGAIVLGLDLIDAQLGNAAARERTLVQREVKLLVRLVDDLLDAARAMHGGGSGAARSGASGFDIAWPSGGPPRPAPPAAASAGRPGGPARALAVLVVDDNVEAARIVGDAVRLMGHTPTVVHDAETALSLPAADVAVLDLDLPGMSGYDLVRRLRERTPAPSTFLVALSGHGEESHVARSREVGFDAHLVKPIDFRTLRDLLSRILAGRAGDALSTASSSRR